MDYTEKEPSIIGEWSWQHAVFHYAIHDPSPSWLINSSIGSPWARWFGGALIADGVETDAATASQPLVPVRVYDPIAEANELIAAATSFDANDNEALIKFVNRWGLLGMAIRDADAQLYDSVFQTRFALERVGRLARRLEALKRRRYTSPELPSLTELASRLTGLPTVLSPRDRSRAQWQGWAVELNQALASCLLQPMLIATDGLPGLKPTWRPRTLGDVLLITLWQHATDGDEVPRRCPVCEGMYFVSASNDKRVYCSTRCKNLGGVRRFRNVPLRRKPHTPKRQVRG